MFIKSLQPSQINKNTFAKNKSFFLQIVPDRQFLIKLGVPEDRILSEEEMLMHPHYYWLKKVVRQTHQQHMFPYKLRASDFKGPESMKLLAELFHIDSYEELNDLQYIVINRDRMKLPMGGRFSDEESSAALPMKFVQNPHRVST